MNVQKNVRKKMENKERIKQILCNVPNELFCKRLMDMYEELAEIIAGELDEKTKMHKE